MAKKNYKLHNGKGFPRDFPTLLPKFSCLVCPLGKSTRPYKHTAAFKAAGSRNILLHQGSTFNVPDSNTPMVPEPDELLVNVGDTLQGETLEAIQADVEAMLGRLDLSLSSLVFLVRASPRS
eukprot:30083-Rhodomonas_salina.1